MVAQQEGVGLYIKYEVCKVGSGETVTDCFVLRPKNDPAAREALRAYADATENKELAEDIRLWLANLESIRKFNETWGQ